MRKFLLVGVISVLLGGCFGGDSDDNQTVRVEEGFKLHETDEFSLQVPEEWEVLTPINFQSDVPKNTVAAFRNNMKNAKFTANIAVVRNDIPLETTTLDYAKALREKTQNRLLNGREVSVEESKIFIGEIESDTLFIHLQGREQPQTDLKHYLQNTGVKEQTAYVAIGAYLDGSSGDISDRVETAVRSLRVK